MRFGVVILPDARWQEAEPRWRRAEALGFDHAWTYDHLAWRTLHDAPWFGAVPTLTAAAIVTSRIRLGPLVASANFRHPVPFAKELMTLDDVSGGRLTVGIGAGGEGWDATMLGGAAWSAVERGERFGEFVALTDQLLRQPSTTFDGRYYRAHEARSIPGCIQQPRAPFVIAATGRRGMEVAAAHAQAWVTTGDRSSTGPIGAAAGALMVRDMVERLHRTCERVGRDPSTIDVMVLTGPQLSPCFESPASFRDAVARYEAVGVSDFVVHWPRPDGPFAESVARFEAAVGAGVGAY
ncbi:MAG TPA: LLM class flavin-dependent oxidoreductase [Acidimicrobiia bacterium]|jgi:alkanesulfonate monooxygenase SsuD/methylene tetrahydromethanopterin reductase-like flavin-dependent oxidoreductase (luciferase family)